MRSTTPNDLHHLDTLKCHMCVLAAAGDRTPPAISVPANIRREADGSGLDAKTIVAYTVSATDLVDGDVTVTCNHPSGSDFGPVGETEVTCFAQDTRGNNATKSFTVFLGESFCPNCAQIDEGRGQLGHPTCVGWCTAVRNASNQREHCSSLPDLSHSRNPSLGLGRTICCCGRRFMAVGCTAVPSTRAQSIEA
jgi:hypothetical protein